jgi:periplasmic copper chaperone A
MRGFRFLPLIAALGLGSTAALAQVSVSDPWVRGTVESQMATGAFMRLTAATDARLLGARSPVAGIVEIHEMALENNVMRMREISRLDLPAGRTVELRPGGYHVMLLDLKRTLKPGEEVPITLEIEQGGKRMSVQVKAIVRPLTSATTAPRH